MELAGLHIKLITFYNFKQKITETNLKCANLKNHLMLLCMLFGLSNLNENCKYCYESGYFQSGAPFSSLIVDCMKIINTRLRPQMISIIETAMPVKDSYLQTAVGNEYGDIYETHLAWAQDSKLNHTPDGDAIPEGYLEFMMPILQAKL